MQVVVRDPLGCTHIIGFNGDEVVGVESVLRLFGEGGEAVNITRMFVGAVRELDQLPPGFEYVNVKGYVQRAST